MIEQKDLLLRNSATQSQRLRNTIDFCEQEERDMERLTHDIHLAEVELTHLQEVLQIARSLLSPKCSKVPSHSSSSGGRGDDPQLSHPFGKCGLLRSPITGTRMGRKM